MNDLSSHAVIRQSTLPIRKQLIRYPIVDLIDRHRDFPLPSRSLQYFPFTAKRSGMLPGAP